MPNQFDQLLEFALQQVAAESYLDEFFAGNLTLRDVLIAGNNRVGFADRSYSRMTPELADRFIARYQILRAKHHYPNDSSGFSATRLFDTHTGEYTLAMRSTEFRNQSDGGDFERDGSGAGGGGATDADAGECGGGRGPLVRRTPNLLFSISAVLLLSSAAVFAVDGDTRELGERFDPTKYEQCIEEGRRRYGLRANVTDCEIYRLRRIPAPEYWPGGSRKPDLPPAFQDTGYRHGMTAKEYFEHLCKTEAGEFIYRTVENVEAVFQIRPRRWAGDVAKRDLYVLEDPYGYTDGEATRAPLQFLGTSGYKFFETPIRGGFSASGLERYYDESISAAPTPGARYRKYIHSPDSRGSIRLEFVETVQSRYGYTWRELRRPKDREHRISGGELIIVELATGEVLGVRRGFMWAPASRYGSVNWDSGAYCPVLKNKPKGLQWDKDVSFTRWFLYQVLKPGTQTN